MKKILCLILTVMLFTTLFSSAFAADLSAFESKCPPKINLAPFKTDSYNCSYDQFLYTAEIVTENKIAAGLGFQNNEELYFTFIVTMNNQKYTPGIRCTNYSLNNGLGTLYFRIGENRYALPVQDSEDYYCYYRFDKTALELFNDIITTNETVYLSTTGYTKKTPYEITAEDKEYIINFLDDFSTAGLTEQYPIATFVISSDK